METGPAAGRRSTLTPFGSDGMASTMAPDPSGRNTTTSRGMISGPPPGTVPAGTSPVAPSAGPAPVRRATDAPGPGEGEIAKETSSGTGVPDGPVAGGATAGYPSEGAPAAGAPSGSASGSRPGSATCQDGGIGHGGGLTEALMLGILRRHAAPTASGS
ncbi:hypothetical protein GCM10023195_68090 [Actinoallomurus liliacearum]|uniref:Uncharacterized protein n=1 Tax=Actinoallomurus liliacearum TaxID=1080073 RepID=A0ABP8TSY5_9ACTN